MKHLPGFNICSTNKVVSVKIRLFSVLFVFSDKDQMIYKPLEASSGQGIVKYQQKDWESSPGLFRVLPTIRFVCRRLVNEA